MASASEKEPLITFTIKNPSKHEADAFRLCVPLSATLADIQRRIAAEYDGNPIPQLQTLIYAGKVLKDPTLMVKDIVQQTGPAADGSTHSMHLVVRAPAAAVGSTAAAAMPRPAQVAAGTGHSSGAVGPSQTPEVPLTPAAHASGGAAPAPVAVEAPPAPLDSPDAHSRSERSSGGGSSTSGQHDEGFSDGGAGPAGVPGFSAPAGMPPMVVFGTPGTSSGLLYAGHGPAGQLGMMGPLRGLSQPGASSSGGAVGAAAAPGVLPPMAPGIQHMSYPYMMNFMNPLMSSNVMTAAYQAAYSAALQSMQQQQQTSSVADPSAAAAAAGAASTSAAGAGTSTAGSEPGSSSAAAAAPGATGGLHSAPAATHTPLMPLTAPLAPAALLYYPAAFQQAAMAAAVAAAANQQQAGQNQQQPHPHAAAFAPPAGPFPMAAPFAVPLVGFPAHLAAGQAAAAAAAAGQAAGAGAAAVGAGGAAGIARVGLHQRFPQGFAMMAQRAGGRQQQQGQAVGPAGAAAGQGGPHPHGGHRRYRTRTITFRISMRTLLQMLVFGVVLYQHCTWPRLCILLFGSIILYITALWPPFRQFVVSLARPPQPEQLAQMRQRREQAAAAAAPHQPQQQLEQQHGVAAAAAGGQQLQEQVGGAGAGAAAAGQDAPPQAQAAIPGGAVPGAGAAAAPQLGAAAAGVPAGGQPPLPAWLQQGLLREVLAVLVSFVTSLFPAWNYNAEDAAVFAAAQEMLAREEQQQRQQQGGGQGQAAGAGPGGGGGGAGFHE